MRHQIYTFIFMQGINRTPNVPNCVIVACGEFMGAHKHLSVFGIFNYVHCTWSCGGGQKTCTTVPQAKMFIGDIHHRGMGFAGAHVWKMSHPQAMEFFVLKNLDPRGMGCYSPNIISVKTSLLSKPYAQKVCASSSAHTWFSLHMVTSYSCRQTTWNARNDISNRLWYTCMCHGPCDHDKIVTNWRTYVDIFTSISKENKNTCK